MTPERLVNRLQNRTSVVFNIVADDDDANKVKVTRKVGDYRYTFRFNESDGAKCKLVIKGDNNNEHRSVQRVKKAAAMVLKHIASPNTPFKVLFAEQEIED
jgi:hypothetical protein